MTGSTRALHRRAPDPAPLPDYVVPLGRTVSLPMNGAMSRLAVTPESSVRLRDELRTGDFDVIHVHEPIAPVVGWDACTFDAGAPGGRHVPRLLLELDPEHDRAHDRRAPRLQPAARAHRGVRGGALDRRALLRRHLRRDPERRRHRRRAGRPEAAVRRAAHRLRRSRGGAQGPARPAVRLRGPAPAHPGAAAGDRRGGRRRRAAARPGRGRHGRHRGARPRATTTSCGGSCTTRTCCARPRSAARASAWC